MAMQLQPTAHPLHLAAHALLATPQGQLRHVAGAVGLWFVCGSTRGFGSCCSVEAHTHTRSWSETAAVAAAAAVLASSVPQRRERHRSVVAPDSRRHRSKAGRCLHNAACREHAVARLHAGAGAIVSARRTLRRTPEDSDSVRLSLTQSDSSLWCQSGSFDAAVFLNLGEHCRFI